MGRPDNQKIDVETLKRQLRREMDEKIQLALEAYSDESEEDGGLTLVLVGDPEDSGDDVEDDGDQGGNNPTKPFIDVKFRNKNNKLVKPTESNAFGNILKSSDGTLSVSVDGKIIDDQKGIEKYKIRIKRID